MFIRNLLILLVTCGACVTAKRYFPDLVCDFLVDRLDINGTTMVVKKVYDAKTRCSANGTGKEKLKILYQNGGNVKKTYDMIDDIETMLDSVRPHVFFMCENRMDTKTRDRLQNRHGFCVEESTVPYTRRRDCEIKGICSLWLEFGTGASRYVVIGAYREWKRLEDPDRTRTREKQKVRWDKFTQGVADFINNNNIESHMSRTVFLFQIGAQSWDQ